MTDSTGESIKILARELGFARASFTSAAPLLEDATRLEEWCQEGAVAGMGWLSRDPRRRAWPQRYWPQARSVISLAYAYPGEEVPPPPRFPAGRVARYAWGKDYHEILQEKTQHLMDRLSDLLGPGVEARNVCDVEPLLERALARRSGLAFIGKNTNAIAPRLGSTFFLAEVLVNVDLPEDPPPTPGCGDCTRCQSACPTGALDHAYRLDARRCIAYHTIENRGPIPREFRRGLGQWLFGCDDCQEVCPFNSRTAPPEERLRLSAGPGAWVNLSEVMSLRTDEEFKEKFQGTSLLRAKRAGLVRNACLVSANGSWGKELEENVIDCLREDSSPVVRGAAAWALKHATSTNARAALSRALGVERDPHVREEIQWALD